MSKNVVFSFDDGRLDTYTNAYRILKQYDMPFTLNVCTDFVEHPEKYTCFQSADNKSVSVEHLIEMQQDGVEIACHGHLHNNTKEDVLDNIAALKRMGIDVTNIGFASPNSEITLDNASDLLELVKDGTLSYIRSGIQVRREGFLYSVLTYVERRIHSERLFGYLNKRNIITNADTPILMSVTITSSTTVEQIVKLIDKMQDGESVILMFHSVIEDGDTGYGKDCWYFDINRFREVCNCIKSRQDVIVCTTNDIVAKLDKL